MKILSLTNANNLKEDLKIPALLQSLDFTEMSIIQTYVKMKAKDLLINFESYLSNIDVVEITHVFLLMIIGLWTHHELSTTITLDK